MNAVPISPFRYTDPGTPAGYVCGCGAHGVCLYREYQTFLDHQALRCRACAIKQRNKPEREADRMLRDPHEHSIGWLVAAVPTEEGDTFWGYTSVPEAGVKWWDNLPKQ